MIGLGLVSHSHHCNTIYRLIHHTKLYNAKAFNVFRKTFLTSASLPNDKQILD